MSGEDARIPLVSSKLASIVTEALQPPVRATDQEMRVAKAICEADHHEWPDDSYNGRTQVRAYLKLARAALATARVAELEAQLRTLSNAAQAVVAYDGEDAKPPFVELLLRLEAEVACSRSAPVPTAEGEG